MTRTRASVDWGQRKATTMATKYVHTVTLDNGTTVTRTSTSRVYTHAVVVKYPETATDWHGKPHYLAGQEAVLTFCGSHQRGLAAVGSERNRLSRATGLAGFTLRLADVTMVEKTTAAPVKEFTVTNTVTGHTVVVKAINAKRALQAATQLVKGPNGWKDATWTNGPYSDLAAVMTKTAKQLEGRP